MGDITKTMSKNTKTSDLDERIALFNAELTLLQKKYELKLGAELVFLPQGVIPKPVVLDQKATKTAEKVEDNDTAEEVVNDEPEKTL